MATVEEVNKAYQDTFGHAPDAAGLEYWSGQDVGNLSAALKAGAQGSDVDNAVSTSINSAYQSNFGREADTAGYDYWTEQAKLNPGMNISAAIAAGAKGTDLIEPTEKLKLPTLTSMRDLSLSSLEPVGDLVLPTLTLGDDTSVVNQRDKILRYDSLPMQQARMQAQENGVASGEIHSSQQEGAAMRAASSDATVLGNLEAERATLEQTSNWQAMSGAEKANWTQRAAEMAANWEAKTEEEKANWTQDISELTSNWTQETTEATSNWNKSVTESLTSYTNEYTAKLDQMGYDSDTTQLMASLNSSLSQSLLSSYTSLMNNTDLELNQGLTDKLLAIINTAQDNNNLTLDMGFSY